MTVERHNHFTRDIKPRGSDCPACENYWAGTPHVGLHACVVDEGQDDTLLSEGSNAVE